MELKYQDFANPSKEWIECTGTGAFASSTAALANTRRYHGMLVAGNGPDDSRQVLLSRLDEVITLGGEKYALGTRIFEDAIDPTGYELVTNFGRHLFPEVEYEISSQLGGVKIMKAILALHGQNTVLVRYRLDTDLQDLQLELQPFVALRNYHHLSVDRQAGPTVSVNSSGFSLSLGDRNLYLEVLNSHYEPRLEWHRDVCYPVEQERGYDYKEDLYLPGVINVDFDPEEDLFVVVSDSPIENIKPCKLWKEEVRRREKLATVSPSVPKRLSLAADQFIVRDVDKSLNIIAGYPWFTCWARDTMIALPGLCLVTGKLSEARQILMNWSGYLSNGMLPNRIGVSNEVKYNTVDGTLWFVVACYKYLNANPQDLDFKTSIYPKLIDIVDWHIRGTRFGIVMDQHDSLLCAGGDSTQLTWMDACPDGVPVTPRHGKAVEVNALWFNTLLICSDLSVEMGKSNKAKELSSLAAEVRESFLMQFWLSEQGYFADCISPDGVDASLRPNQLLASYLPFSLIEADMARSMLLIVQRKLLTPVGLRTLSPDDPSYKGRYHGAVSERDQAYHQGTVWPWLLLLYAGSIRKFGGDSTGQGLVALFDQSMATLDEGGIGSVSEIYDGDHVRLPRGCIAQAWSVAALLEIHQLITQLD